MWPLFSGFLGGIVAWIITTILGQPIQRFIQLREHAALILARYDNLPWIGNPEAKPPENNWLEERREAYDKIGSELVAFADANTFIARQLHHKILGRYRIYVEMRETNYALSVQRTPERNLGIKFAKARCPL